MCRALACAAFILAWLCALCQSASAQKLPVQSLSPNLPFVFPAVPLQQPGTSQQPGLVQNPIGATHPQSPPVANGDLAYGAFQRGYYVTAMAEALKRVSANDRDAPALTLIGELYAEGLGVRQSSTEALHWYHLACLENNREACFAEGTLYLLGRGVAQDKRQAKALFEKAASQNHAGALFNLGQMALEGSDARPQPDFAAAAQYFQKGAEAGDMDSAYGLALLYREGKGVPKDLDACAHWLKIAADNKNIAAEVEYGIMVFRANEARGAGADPLEDARAARYLIDAASKHNPIAENRLARLFAAGRGVPKDYVASAKWHVLARASGIEDAWLDGILNALSPHDKQRVEEAVAREIGE